MVIQIKQLGLTILVALLAWSISAHGQTRPAGTGRRPVPRVRVLAGGYGNHADGPGPTARFYYPDGIAIGPNGVLYVADTNNNRIRCVQPDGLVSTLAGSGAEGATDGPAATACFNRPTGIAVNAQGTVYVADSFSKTIRTITPDGQVSTLAGSGEAGTADGRGRAASFGTPGGLAIDAAGTLYVTDTEFSLVRKITPDGLVSTLPGGWRCCLTEAQQDTTVTLANPVGIALGADGTVYVADAGHRRICRITPAGRVSVLAGPKKISAAYQPDSLARLFYRPMGLAVGADGTVYVTDAGNQCISRITPDGRVSNWAGPHNYVVSGFVNGPGRAARFDYPAGLALAPNGTLYVADAGNHRIRTVSARGYVGTLAGSGQATCLDGQGRAARFNYPSGVAVAPNGTVYVADGYNHCIRKITPGGRVTTLAGAGRAGFADGIGRDARFNFPVGVAVDAAGTVYVADADNHRIRKITPQGRVSTLAGTGKAGFANGAGRAARFRRPTGVALAADGTLYVADPGNDRIRRIGRDGRVSTAADLRLWNECANEGVSVSPTGVAVAPDGTRYVVSNGTCRVYKVTPKGKISILAGCGPECICWLGNDDSLLYPTAVALASGGTLYVADTGKSSIRRISPNGLLTTLIHGEEAYDDGVLNAGIDHPGGVAVDATGRVYVVDTGHNRILVVE